jgi:hypothetical protein
MSDYNFEGMILTAGALREVSRWCSIHNFKGMILTAGALGSELVVFRNICHSRFSSFFAKNKFPQHYIP